MDLFHGEFIYSMGMYFMVVNLSHGEIIPWVSGNLWACLTIWSQGWAHFWAQDAQNANCRPLKRSLMLKRAFRHLAEGPAYLMGGHSGSQAGKEK